jgi:hypothetical protein
MRYYKLFLPFVILILGTNTTSIRSQTDPTATAFRQFGHDFFGRYKADKHEQVLRLGNGWVKMSFEPVETSVQNGVLARRSPVIPFVGTVQFAVIRHFTISHRTKEDAEQDNELIDGDSWTHRYTFTYQNGAWVEEGNQCEQGAGFVLDDRESGRNPKAQFGFHDCTQGEG